MPVFLNLSITKAQNNSGDSIKTKAEKLKHLYVLSTASSSDMKDVYKQQFFDEFPNTFKGLNDLYGYENSKPAILYFESAAHILELFNNLQNINDTLYYKKIISIAINGHWDADAVNYFQHGLRNRTEFKPELIVYILKSLPEEQIKSFWYFYFDGVHPKKEIADSLLKIKSIDNKVYTLMLAAHQEILNQPKE
ncbi:hypothetical protein SAMN05216490_2895 [Mucilaginibacter mallensis]|uniref:Uncharacterized protein n=2 Tax=Mucilaginibacter mallensis TaxID=652787 RepID=A0A1H1YYK6_MUCMA|nr:hypothetical protein SAMN05216490_2895 [Mucilaginibacter mallensis]